MSSLKIIQVLGLLTFIQFDTHTFVYLLTHSLTKPFINDPRDKSSKSRSPFLIHRPLCSPPLLSTPSVNAISQAKGILELSFPAIYFPFQFPHPKSHHSIHHLYWLKNSLMTAPTFIVPFLGQLFYYSQQGATNYHSHLQKKLLYKYK